MGATTSSPTSPALGGGHGPESGKLVKRLEVGQNGANVSFRPDGAYGYVAVTGENAVAVVEMESLDMESRLDVGKEPMGLIVL